MTDWSSAKIALVRGFALQRKPCAGGSYPAYSPCDSNQGWHGEWFYIRNPVGALFSAFTGGRPVKQKSWSWGCTHMERHKVEVIEAELRKLVRGGLDVVRVFHTLYRRWRRGRTRCGSTVAGRTWTVRRRMSYRTTRSGAASTECCS